MTELLRARWATSLAFAVAVPKGEAMTEHHAELDAALDRVITAARDHLAAVGPPRAGWTTTVSGAPTSPSTTPRTSTTNSCWTRSARSRRGTWRRSIRTRRTSASVPGSAWTAASRPTRTRRWSPYGSAATTGCRAWPRCCGRLRRPAAASRRGERGSRPTGGGGRRGGAGAAAGRRRVAGRAGRAGAGAAGRRGVVARCPSHWTWRRSGRTTRSARSSRADDRLVGRLDEHPYADLGLDDDDDEDEDDLDDEFAGHLRRGG